MNPKSEAFADDITVTIKATEENLTNLKGILVHFGEISGLRINI